MKFTLTYQGQLPASANGKPRAAEKWAIRNRCLISVQMLIENEEAST